MLPMTNAAGVVKKTSDLRDLIRLSPDILPAITLGSFTWDERTGNEGNSFWYDESSRPTSLNALGLPNPGIAKTNTRTMLRSMIAMIQQSGKKARISIADFHPEIYGIIVQAICEMGPDEIEVNLGCPNVRSADGRQKQIVAFDPDLIQKVLMEIYQHNLNPKGFVPIAVKLSPYSDPALLTKVAEVIAHWSKRIAKVVTCNTFPNAYGPSCISTNDGYGGLGGSAMKYIALGQVRKFRELLPSSIKVVGVGGIATGLDIRDFEKAGADEVQVGTTFFVEGPRIFPRLAEECVALTEK